MGDDRLVFNRDRLIVLSGAAPAGTLADISRSDLSTDASHPGRSTSRGIEVSMGLL
jgi:hypothetical protein